MKTFTLAILPLALISAFSHAAEEKAAEQAVSHELERGG